LDAPRRALRTLQSRWVVAAMAGGIMLASCGAAGTGNATTTTAPGRPAIVQTEPDTIDFVRPTAAAETWVLSGTRLAKEISLVNLSTHRAPTTVGVDTGARAVATSANGVLAVASGHMKAGTGTLDLYDASHGHLQVVIPLPGPALTVVSGVHATSFWVIEQIGAARVVATFSSTGTPLGAAVPVSPALADIAVFPNQSALWGLLANGTIEQISLPTGQITTSFSTGQAATALALSPSGNTAYVLRSAIPAPNVAQVNLDAQSNTTVYPAPAHSIALAVSANGRTMYVAASSHRFGDIQSFELHG
jgi:hypothetical protein